MVDAVNARHPASLHARLLVQSATRAVKTPNSYHTISLQGSGSPLPLYDLGSIFYTIQRRIITDVKGEWF